MFVGEPDEGGAVVCAVADMYHLEVANDAVEFLPGSSPLVGSIKQRLGRKINQALKG